MPARTFATAVGALLAALGMLGFFYSASFGSPGHSAELLGAFEVNGSWNVLHVATGAAGLLVPGRRYLAATGALYAVLAVWGLAVGSAGAILGFLPVNAGDDALHALVAVACAAGLVASRPASPS
jgi:hypothetical protein